MEEDPTDVGGGMVALVVLIGLVLSPIQKGVRRLYARYGRSRPTAAQPDLVSETTRPTPKEAIGSPAPAGETEVNTEPLLAVLAFDNLSSDPEMQFFSDGVSEEIIQRLSHVAKLQVVGRTSSFQFRGERKQSRVRERATYPKRRLRILSDVDAASAARLLQHLYAAPQLRKTSSACRWCFGISPSSRIFFGFTILGFLHMEGWVWRRPTRQPR